MRLKQVCRLIKQV